jgi:restriction endonuclease Mrr
MNPSEKILREYIREYLKQLKEAEEQEKDATVVDEPQQDQSIQTIIEPLVNSFIRKIKNNMVEVDGEVLHEIIVEMLNALIPSNDEKLSILKNVKNTLIGY